MTNKIVTCLTMEFFNIMIEIVGCSDLTVCVFGWLHLADLPEFEQLKQQGLLSLSSLMAC